MTQPMDPETFQPRKRPATATAALPNPPATTTATQPTAPSTTLPPTSTPNPPAPPPTFTTSEPTPPNFPDIAPRPPAPAPTPSTGTGTAGVPSTTTTTSAGTITHTSLLGGTVQYWQTADGKQFGTEAEAQAWQDQLNARTGGVLGINQGLAQTGDAQTNALINNSTLMNRVNAQTTGDIAGISAGGATGVAGMKAAADEAAATGAGIYADTGAAADAALARGDAALGTALGQGQSAIAMGTNLAQPLFNVGANDQVNAANARTTSTAELGAAAGSLSEADAMVQRLQELAAAGDPNAIAQLQTFQGSAGTAPQLAGFAPDQVLNNKLGLFQGNAGNAPALEGVQTGVSATGDLLNFQGSRGTADQLATMPTGVSGTGALANFQGEGGVSVDQLERIAAGGDVGPSAAEALLRKGYDTTLAQNLALARSGRNAGDIQANTRAAIFANAGAGQQLANDLAAQRAAEAATQRTQNIQAATAAAGARTTESAQTLAAKQAVQQGQLQAEQDRLQALVESGKLTQAQAAQQLDAFKSAQQGQLASVQQRSENLATAGAQRQTQAAQQLAATQTAATNQIAAERQRLDALVASGQMTQQQAAQQLSALQSTLQGQLQAQQNRITAATQAAGAANTSAATSADLAKSFATLGLQYDVNSGNVYNQAGQLIMTGEQVAQQLTSSGLSAQVGQGQVAANVTGTGAQALTTMMNTSTDAKKAASVLGFQTASAIASLSQGELAQLEGLVNSQNQGEMQNMLAQKGIALQIDQANAQQAGAVMSAIGTIAAGAALLLSDVRAKTDVEPMGAADWASSFGPTPGSMVDPGFKPIKDLSTDRGGFGGASASSAGLTDQQKMALLGLGGQLGGSIGRAFASDERGKVKKPETFEEWLGMMPEPNMRAAKGYGFRYKDPKAMGAAPGRYYGPMAQDVAKTAAGGAVKKMPNGMLGIDPRQTIMPMMAAVAEQQNRIDDLEARLKELAK